MARRRYGNSTKKSKTEALKNSEQARCYFLELAREIRDHIYFLVLRPDISENMQENDDEEYTQCLGCTAILVTCRQVHEEARQLLAAKQQTIKIHGRGSLVFRSMFDHGKPGYFRCSSYISRIHIPPRFCELQVVRFRRLTIDIFYSFYDGSFSRLTAEFTEIVNVLKKTQALENLQIRIQGSEKGKISGRRVCQLVRMLTPMVWVAKAKKFKLSAEVNKFFSQSNRGEACRDYLQYEPDHEEYVVKCFNKICRKNDLLSQNRQVPHIKREDFLEFKDRIQREEREERAKDIMHEFEYGCRGSLPPYYEQYGTLLSGANHDKWEKIIEGHKTYLRTWRSRLEGHLIYKWHEYLQRHTTKMSDLETPWTLTPECRTCMRIFENEAELQNHLARSPKHRRKFFKRRENFLHKSAVRSQTKHKCAICAWSPTGFETFVKLRRHRDEFGHHGNEMAKRWRRWR